MSSDPGLNIGDIINPIISAKKAYKKTYVPIAKKTYPPRCRLYLYAKSRNGMIIKKSVLKKLRIETLFKLVVESSYLTVY